MLYDQIQEAVDYIRAKTERGVRFGIILGTGLGKLREEMQIEEIIPYHDIPHFPVSTVQSHAGELLFGRLAGKNVVAMAGRFHYYEGYSMQQVTFPVRVMKFMGVERLFITYDKRLIARALKIAHREGIRAHEGVYAALPGPNLETPAEYRYLNRIGADLVGMSTIPEVLVAKHMELPVFVASVVSNQCYPIDQLTETSVEEVIAMVQSAEPRLRLIVRELLADL